MDLWPERTAAAVSLNPYLTYIELGAAAALLAIAAGAGYHFGGLSADDKLNAYKTEVEAQHAVQLSAVATAYQDQVLAREASEAKLQKVQNAYDTLKDLPDVASVGTAHRLLLVAASTDRTGGCDVPAAGAVAGGAQASAAVALGHSSVESALGDVLAACAADASQMNAMVQLAP
jgi:hypothetical protein